MKYKKAMKDFENLTTEEQGNVIMQIGSKLTGQEIWYWEGIVHLLREQDKRINKAIEYLESYNTDFKNCRFGEAPISIRELGDLLDILKGSDKE